jgi:hypothetical protein
MLPSILQHFYSRKQEVIDYSSGLTKHVESHPLHEGALEAKFNLTPTDVYEEQEEVIYVEQDMNLSFYHDVDTEPIPIDIHAGDLNFLQQALGGQQQQQRFVPAPQPVGFSYSIGNMHSSTTQGNRGHTHSIPTQQVSALDTDYFIATGFDWNDAAHGDNDPEMALWSR